MSTELSNDALKHYTELAEKARNVSGVVNAYVKLEECAVAIDELVREVYELNERFLN